MKICEHLQSENIFLNTKISNKEDVLWFAADTFFRKGIVKDARVLYEGLKEREQLMSTGVGGGIGIPHTISSEAENAAVMLIQLVNPIEFGALDKRPVDIIWAIVIPEKRTNLHLRILAGLSRICRTSEFLNAIRKAEDPEMLLAQIKKTEEKIAFH